MSTLAFHYTSAPKIQAAMERLAEEHATFLGVALKDLEALGAEPNELVSLLSHSAAQAAARALAILKARIDFFESEGAQGLAGKLFLLDVMQRAQAMRESSRQGDQENG